MVERWERPVEVDRKEKGFFQVGDLTVAFDDLVLKGQQDPGVDLEGHVEVERTTAGFLRVELHLPGLTERVRLDEVALGVNVKPVLDGVGFQVGDETGDVDGWHGWPSWRGLAARLPQPRA